MIFYKCHIRVNQTFDLLDSLLPVLAVDSVISITISYMWWARTTLAWAKGSRPKCILLRFLILLPGLLRPGNNLRHLFSEAQPMNIRPYNLPNASIPHFISPEWGKGKGFLENFQENRISFPRITS